MKKFWLCLGLGLILACWCGGLGTGTAFGQYYGSRGQYYDSRHLSCDPRDPSCYRDYHAAPYADPLSQFLYYVAPPVGRDQRYQRYETNRERKQLNRQERQDLRQRQYQQHY